MREMINNLQIVGTLKSKNIEEKVSQAGEEFITGDLIVLVNTPNGVSEVKVDLYSKKYTKKGTINTKYSGYQTINSEYKTIVDDEDGERILVNGNIGFEEYNDKRTGEYKFFNTYRADFINRLTEVREDSAKVETEIVITDVEEPNEDNVDAKISGINVGYNGYLIPIKDMVIAPELFNQVKDHYKVGETVKIQCDIKNEVQVVEEEVDSGAVFGYVEPKIIKNFFREIRIVGGYLPYDAGQLDANKQPMKVNETEFNQILQSRKTTVQGLTKPVASNFAPMGNTPTFGSPAANNNAFGNVPF